MLKKLLFPKITNVNFIHTFIFISLLPSVHLYSQTALINYSTSSLDQSKTNVFDPPVDVNGHTHSTIIYNTNPVGIIGAPTFNGTSIVLRANQEGEENCTNGSCVQVKSFLYGTAYKIAYGFRTGYTYYVSINVTAIAPTTGYIQGRQVVGLGASIGTPSYTTDPQSTGFWPTIYSTLSPIFGSVGYPIPTFYCETNFLKNPMYTTYFNSPGNFTVNIPAFSVADNTNNVLNIESFPSPFVYLDALNINSVTILRLSGPTLICNSADYSFSNLPSGASVSWSTNGGSTYELHPNTPTLNTLRIINKKYYTASAVLSALISNLGSGIPDQTVSKQIENDNSTSATSDYDYYQEACTFYNVSHPSMSGTMQSNSSPLFVHQGCTVYIALGDLTGRTVTLASGSGTPLEWGVEPTSPYFNTNTLYFQLPLGSGGIPFTFDINGNGACYQRTLLFFSMSNNAKPIYNFSVSPNPANNIIRIESTISNKEPSSKIDIREIQLIDKMGIINYRKQFEKGLCDITIPVTQLKNDIYVLKIFDGESWDSQKIIVRH